MKKLTPFFSKLVSIIFALSLGFAIITFSIGIPIYFRPFYYMQIDSLGVENATGHTKTEIKEAYNELLDYLTLGEEFGMGVFEYSESGKSHFEDCKALFNLNTTVFIISFSAIIITSAICKFKKMKLWRPWGLHMSFFAAASILSVFSVTGMLIALNFKKAFNIFHRIFFFGKSNWFFNTETDPIVLALPNEFFMNSAIIIFGSIISISLVIIVISLVKRTKNPD